MQRLQNFLGLPVAPGSRKPSLLSQNIQKFISLRDKELWFDRRIKSKKIILLVYVLYSLGLKIDAKSEKKNFKIFRQTKK